MLSTWPATRLGELAIFKTGKLDSNAAVEHGDYPFFTCSQETFRTNTFSFDGECVLLAGNNANGIFPLKYYYGKFDAYQRTYVITTRDPNQLVIRFLYYALRQKLSEFRSFSTGAATKFLTMKILNRTEIHLPSLREQRRIASILGRYDDLIEVNRRRIALLEEMTRRLFEEWFVLYRFPGHEGQAIVRTPQGSMPKGWRRAQLDEVASVNNKTIRPESAPARIGYVDISSVTRGEVEKIDWMNFSDAPGRARRKVRDGSIIWSTVRPNRRSYALIFNPSDDLIFSTGFAVLDAKSVSVAYLHHFTTTDDFVGYLVSNATGSAYPAVTGAVFARASILVPPHEIDQQFSSIAEPALRLISNLHTQNNRLGASRDHLLPRLISGTLSISKAERELEAVA